MSWFSLRQAILFEAVFVILPGNFVGLYIISICVPLSPHSLVVCHSKCRVLSYRISRVTNHSTPRKSFLAGQALLSQIIRK